MSYFIVPTVNCVFLTCEVDIPLAEMTAAWREVRDELAQKNLNRVLVDVTALRTSPDTDDIFDFEKLFCRDLPQNGQITMMVRSAGTSLTVFVTEEQAEAGILEEAQGQHQLPEGLIPPRRSAAHRQVRRDKRDLLKGPSPCRTS